MGEKEFFYDGAHPHSSGCVLRCSRGLSDADSFLPSQNRRTIIHFKFPFNFTHYQTMLLRWILPNAKLYSMYLLATDILCQTSNTDRTIVNVRTVCFSEYPPRATVHGREKDCALNTETCAGCRTSSEELPPLHRSTKNQNFFFMMKTLRTCENFLFLFGDHFTEEEIAYSYNTELYIVNRCM